MKTTMKIMKKLGGVLAVAVMGFVTHGAQAGVTYFHNDIAGSPVAATNEAGTVIWRESFWPYGERRVNSASAGENKVWFTSRRQDVETGLVYMGARYYDPVVGRFISTDPVGFDEQNVHSFNRYAYANNNPYRYVDLDGRTAAAIAVVGIGVVAIGGGFQRLPQEQQSRVLRGLGHLSGYTAIGNLGSLISNVINSEGNPSDAGGAPVPGAKPGRETKGRTKQWEKPGDMKDANRDFDDKGPEEVRELPNGGRVGTLPDGRTIVVRPDSSDGRPTLEIQSGKNKDKVRYGE